MGLVAAEVRKLTTVRTTWVVSLIGLALIVLGTALVVFEETMTGPFTGSDGEVAAAIGQIGSTSVIVLVVAVLVMTTEFRHGTIGRTLQLVPSRSRVLAGKLTAGVVYAVAFTLAGLAAVGAIVWLGAATKGVALQLGEETFRAVWQGVVALVLTGLLGVAVGALLRSQVVGLTVSLVWVFVVENLVVAFLPAVGRWLPFTALQAMFVTVEVTADGQPVGMGFTPLEPAVALTAFLCYVAAATVLAGVLMRTRDV